MTIELIKSAEVATALANGTPVVALESTIITHGMPPPINLETARGVEAVIREHGAVPATIAVLDGRVHIGLEEAELTALSQADDVMKLSRADFAFALARGATGSTTVAATMIAAHLAGISVFATGGIGGVHRGAEHSFDISADLRELGQTPVIVVAAGAKAILDIPKTLEVLETGGVPVVTFGAAEFPAFWSRSSGLASPMSSDKPAEMAKAFQTRRDMGLKGGMLVANPIPPGDEIPRAVLEPLISQALAEADAAGITAKDVTPYLLNRVFELTQGRSLTANIALIKNNARLAAELASHLASMN